MKYLEKKKYKGINYEIIPDPTGNKIHRLRIIINIKNSGFTPQSLAYYLEKNNPSIFVRDDLIHLNHFELDTCNLKKNQEKMNFFYLGKKNNWKKLLNPKVEKKIRETFKREMKELGYI